MLELMILFFFCGLLGLGSIGALGWVLTAEEIGVERIFLLLVCASLAALFLGMAAWIARYTQLRELWKPGKEAAPKAAEASAQKQGPAREEMGKSAS